MTKVVPSMSRPPKRTASRKESLPAEPATLSEWWELAIANKDLLLVEGVPVIPVAEAPANHWMNKAVQLQSCAGVDTHFYTARRPPCWRQVLVTCLWLTGRRSVSNG